MNPCSSQGIKPIFYNNYKWNITFKKCESLCCTSEIYNIVHQLYLKKKKKKNQTTPDLERYRSSWARESSVANQTLAFFCCCLFLFCFGHTEWLTGS